MKTLLTILLFFFLFSTHVGFAQNQIFLSKKADDFPKSNVTAGITSTRSVAPSVSSDKRFMTVNITKININMDMEGSKVNMQPTSLLFDLETGNVVKKYRNTTLNFTEEGLIKSFYGGIWDKKFDTANFGKMFENTKHDFVDPLTGQSKKSFEFPEGHMFTRVSGNYIISQHILERTSYLWVKTPKGVKEIAKVPFTGAVISTDGNLVSGAINDFQNPGNSRIEIYETETGDLVKKILVQGNPSLTKVIDRQRLIYSTLSGIKVVDYNTGKELAHFKNVGRGYPVFMVNDSAERMLIQSSLKGEIKLIDLRDYSTIHTERFAYLDEKKPYAIGTSFPVKVGKGEFFMIGNPSGIINLVSNKEKKIVADIYVDQEDWAVVARDGRVDGTPGALDKLEWREYDRNGKVVNRTSLDAAFNNFFTPGLLSSLLKGEEGDISELKEQMAKAPSVSIVNPSNGIKSNDKEVTVSVKATENGDPVKEIRLFVNGKLVGGGERGLKLVQQNEASFDVILAPGQNMISARAISEKGYESPADYININYTGQQTKANLHVLAVGINQYVNSSYNLNYAVADAGAIVKNIQDRSAGIFGDTKVYAIYDQDATQQKIKDTFRQIAESSKPTDVFVFFYAGHGVMSEGADKEFYLALHDVTQLYGKEEMLKKKGISAEELKSLTSEIKAQKQMIILDACQSGGAVETFAMRGAAEEKAMIQLARSSGVTLLASTGTEQYATEFDQLGHGVFTYALLDGLEGKADGGRMDNKITVKELEAYLNDTIPVLTQKYKGTAQFPRSWSQGMDFPIGVINE